MTEATANDVAAPPRPSTVPGEARWFFDAQEWLSCKRDENGELHGSLRSYRADGTPWLEYEYRHGQRHGPFRRFHTSGQVGQAGRYFDDLLDGLLSVFSDGEDTYTIRECCIAPGTRVMKQEHRRGKLLAESFYAADGTRLFDPNATSPVSAWPEPLREREGDWFWVAFDFWPSREPLVVADPDAARVEQSLPALCAAISRAAQRVQVCRVELISRGETQIPPHVSLLIADDALRRFSFTSEEGEPVNVDETLAVQGLSTHELALTTRIEWTALCWLCWAAGLDKIAIPTQITARPQLYAALIIVSERDAALSGNDPRPSSEPHFHSLDETLFPASTLTHLAAHYREIRAVLLFASDPECQSPWQDDLGRS
jgi:hypothetical protein